METLERLGVADNTLVIFTSDNGPEVTTVLHMRADYGHDGARPWRGLKRDNWEGGHRVPFIVRWPGHVKPGTVCDLPICHTDIMATCAEIVGAPLPNNAAEDSTSFLAALLGRPSPSDSPRILLHETISLALGIRYGQWKYLDTKARAVTATIGHHSPLWLSRIQLQTLRGSFTIWPTIPANGSISRPKSPN